VRRCGLSGPEAALDAADNLSVFVAKKVRDLVRAFVAGLGAIEGAHAVEDCAEVFGGWVFVEF
jgi:hypothetical protein